mgnify:FL=1
MHLESMGRHTSLITLVVNIGYKMKKTAITEKHQISGIAEKNSRRRHSNSCLNGEIELERPSSVCWR